MNSLLEALQEGRMVELPDGNKDQALTILANLIEAIPSVPAGTDMTGAVMTREGSGSTALGKAWACPHARLGNEGDLVCAVGWSPSGIEYGAPDGRPVRIVAMYLVPLNQKNAFLREVSGVAKVLQAQPDDTMWANIRDLTQARNALLDMITAGGESAVPEARARMIRLETRRAAVEMPAVAVAGLTVQAVTIIAGSALKPVVLSQHQDLTARLEAVADLTGLLARNGFLDVGGWRILSRGTTPYAADRVMLDCLAVKGAPERPATPQV
ncbi:MAG: PTS transporter subunit EIIA [Kiritimatiellaceae bacterium]|nr:PTS transporter subunit EIIA [Kiritimatiellaceae bacterium]